MLLLVFKKSHTFLRSLDKWYKMFVLVKQVKIHRHRRINNSPVKISKHELCSEGSMTGEG